MAILDTPPAFQIAKKHIFNRKNTNLAINNIIFAGIFTFYDYHFDHRKLFWKRLCIYFYINQCVRNPHLPGVIILISLKKLRDWKIRSGFLVILYDLC